MGGGPPSGGTRPVVRLRQSNAPRKYPTGAAYAPIDKPPHGTGMAVVIDTLDNTRRLRHPEKAHRPDQPVLPKPDWIRVKAPVSPGYFETQRIVRDNGLHTVCEEAGCPNIGEVWDEKHR